MSARSLRTLVATICLTGVRAFSRKRELALRVWFITYAVCTVNKYWINQGAPNSDFWGHEFSKHATCTSTFDVKCYGDDYVEHQEVVDFIEAARRAFNMFPTFDMLAAYVPSPTTHARHIN